MHTLNRMVLWGILTVAGSLGCVATTEDEEALDLPALGDTRCAEEEESDAGTGESDSARCFGCHRVQQMADGVDATGLPDCDAAPDTRADEDFKDLYTPAGLPCGRCGDGDRACRLFVQPLCRIDGQDVPAGEYGDQWVCQCESGQWACRINNASPGACLWDE